jgi:hypothetical protein
MEDLPSQGDIIDCCGSLVVHDSSGIVRFAHYTVSSFLENKYLEHLYAQVDMARACLTYLCFDFFESGPNLVSFLKWQNEWQNRKGTNNFGVYASLYWDLYTRGPGEEDPSVQEQLFQFLMSPSKCLSMLAMRTEWGGFSFFAPRQGEPCVSSLHPWVHIAAGFGLASVCRTVMAQDEPRATPRMQKTGDRARHAEIRELKEALKATMEKEMLISAVDNYGDTPLHAATLAGYKEAVIVLLENGADINARAYDGTTPLHVAAAKGFSSVVSTLLDKDADMTVEDNHGETPLAYTETPAVATAFLDKTAQTPWTLEGLSRYTLYKVSRISQMPRLLRSSFGRELGEMLLRLSQDPSPDCKYVEAFIASRELQISLDPVNASVSRADELTHARVRCDGCRRHPIVGYRYKCAVCDDFDFCHDCYMDPSRSKHFPESRHHFLQIPRDGWRTLALPHDFIEEHEIDDIQSDDLDEASVQTQ